MKRFIQIDKDGNVIDSFTENHFNSSNYVRETNKDILILKVGQEIKFTETTTIKRVE